MLKIIQKILKMSGKYRGKLLLSFLMGFLESSMSACSVIFIFSAFDWHLSGSINTKRISLLAVALSMTVLLRFIFKRLEYILQSGVGYEIVCDERLNLGTKLLHLPMGFYSNTDAGELSSVINSDLVFVEGMAMAYVSKVIGASISAALMVGVLFLLDWRIALIALIAYPLVLLVNKFTQRILISHSKKRQEAHAETSSVMLEYLQGIYVIKAFGLAGHQKKRLENVLKRLEIVSYEFEMKAMPFTALYFVILNLFTMLIILTVSSFVLGGTIPLGTALVLLTMVFSFYAPMELLMISSGFLRLMDECLNRMQSILDHPLMDENGADITPPSFDVSFDNVYFSYGERTVLSGINLHAKENSLTAIVGPSGSGKSTMLNLIARFWDVNSGSIEIGGIDVRTMKCDSVMKYISIIFQKAYLFHDTIESNIRFGNASASRMQVMEAAKKAHCHEFIEKMKNGYDTVVGEGGGTLSGGERQRITIARALLKDTPIVLLDEATANIDPENEMLIQEAINALVQEKTVFVVAHKLSTIQNADQIIVLGSNGTICEKGKHHDLVDRRGLYSGLWEKSQKISQWQLS